MLDKLEAVEIKRQWALGQGGPTAVSKQHALGKLTARERVAILFDHGSFLETGSLVDTIRDTKYNAHLDAAADGVVTGSVRLSAI